MASRTGAGERGSFGACAGSGFTHIVFGGQSTAGTAAPPEHVLIVDS